MANWKITISSRHLQMVGFFVVILVFRGWKRPYSSILMDTGHWTLDWSCKVMESFFIVTTWPGAFRHTLVVKDTSKSIRCHVIPALSTPFLYPLLHIWMNNYPPKNLNRSSIGPWLSSWMVHLHSTEKPNNRNREAPGNWAQVSKTQLVSRVSTGKQTEKNPQSGWTWHRRR